MPPLPVRYAIIVLLGCATFATVLAGCASDPSAPQPRHRRGGDTRPPTPQEMSQLRLGMSTADCRLLVGTRTGVFIRSAVSGQTIEAWEVVPKGTYARYVMLFVNEELDAVVPEGRFANDDTLQVLFGVFLLGDQFIWMAEPERPPLPPLPHAGGDADVVARLRRHAEPPEGIDFAAVDRSRKSDEEQLRGWQLASGFINPVLWFVEDTSVASRKQFLKRLERVPLGASSEQAGAALGEPRWRHSVGDVQYLLFEIDQTWPISIALRGGRVAGVYAWNLQQAATIRGTGVVSGDAEYLVFARHDWPMTVGLGGGVVRGIDTRDWNWSVRQPVSPAAPVASSSTAASGSAE